MYDLRLGSVLARIIDGRLSCVIVPLLVGEGVRWPPLCVVSRISVIAGSGKRLSGDHKFHEGMTEQFVTYLI